MSINERVAALRKEMEIHGIDAVIIPSSDPHQSEYVADHWKSREWISGFTGSAGTAVVCKDHAGIWTDSRYFISAEQELASSEFELHKLNVQGNAEYADFLRDHLKQGAKISLDGNVLSLGLSKHLAAEFQSAEMHFVTDLDLINLAWTDRPSLPKEAIFEHNIKYAGKTISEKLADIRAKMKSLGADYHLINTLDDIAWTFNIRGKDVECNPVAIAYAVIAKEEAFIFIDESKIPTPLNEKLVSNAVQIQAYSSLVPFLSTLSQDQSILVDMNTTSVSVYNAISTKHIIKGSTIPLHLKAIKNETEISHIREVMVKDGVALTKLFMWLEETVKARSISEVEISEKMYFFRSEQANFHGESFTSIIGYKGNGAIVHYRPDKKTCAMVEADGILLTDSGGQYDDGTTDITRTIAMGKPTEEQKRNYTLVLKGHIGLARAKFPKGTRGVQLDILAREHLWAHGLNYLHGTGHGVGFFLNVHEPPQGLAPGLSMRGRTVIEPGMFTSNEPGYYKEGEYGIRIENCVLTIVDESVEKGNFLKFETLTLFPIDTQLLEVSMLTKEETTWLNDYHAEVYEKLAPRLSEKEQIWMKEKCQKL